MSNFFSSDSYHVFGRHTDNGFEEMDNANDWKDEHGDVCIRVYLKPSGQQVDGSMSMLDNPNRSPAFVRIHLQYSENGSTWTDAKFWDISAIDQIHRAGNTTRYSLSTNETFIIDKNRFGSYLQVGDSIPRNESYETRIKIRVLYNPVNKEIASYKTWSYDNGGVPSGIEEGTSNSFRTALTKSHNGNNWNYAGVFYGESDETDDERGQRQMILNFDNPDSDFSFENSTAGGIIDRPMWYMTFKLMNISGTGEGYKTTPYDQGATLNNKAENDDFIKIWYSYDNGASWNAITTIIPTNGYVDESSRGIPEVNTWYQYRVNGFANLGGWNNDVDTGDRDPVRIRFTQNHTLGNAIYDTILIDDLTVYHSNYSGGLYYWGNTQYSTNTKYIVGMFKWDTTQSKVRFKSSDPLAFPGLPGVGDSTGTFFEIGDLNDTAGVISPGPTKAKIEVYGITDGMTSHLPPNQPAGIWGATNQIPVGNTVVVDRFTRVRMIVRNYNPAVVVIPDPSIHKSAMLDIDRDDFDIVDVFTTGMTSAGLYDTTQNWQFRANYSGIDGWSSIRLDMDLVGVMELEDYFEDITFYVQLYAYARDRSNNEFLIDSYLFNQTKSPTYYFNIDDSLRPWNYVTYSMPGKVGPNDTTYNHMGSYINNPAPTAVTQIGINNIKVRPDQNSLNHAVNYISVVRKDPGNQNIAQFHAEGCNDNGGLFNAGSGVITNQGTYWITPTSTINFYGGTGTYLANTGHKIQSIVYKNGTPDWTVLGSEYTDIGAAWQLTKRRGWEFAARGINNSGIEFGINMDKESGTWSIPNIILYATESVMGAFWFRIYVEHRANSSAGSTVILDRWFPGVWADANNPLPGGGTPYHQIVGFIEDERLNEYFTSVYKYDEDELKVSVFAMNNVKNIIDEATTDWMQIQEDHGIQHAVLRIANCTPSLSRDSTGANTSKSHRLDVTIRQTYESGEAHYFRIDIFEDDTSIVAINDVPLTSDNHIATYFTYGVAGESLYLDASGDAALNAYRNVFIKATSFNDFQSKRTADGIHYYTKIYLSDLHDSISSGKDFIAQVRALKDDGHYLPAGVPDLVNANQSGNHATDSRERFSYQGHGYNFDHGSTFVFVEADMAVENAGVQPDTEFLIGIKGRPPNDTRKMFDYWTLEVSSDYGSTKTFTLPSNGNTYYYDPELTTFISDVNGLSMDVQSLVGDRFVGTDLNWTVKAWSYGIDLTDDNAELADTHSGTFTVSPWGWNYSHVDEAIVLSQDLVSCPVQFKFGANQSISKPYADRFKLEVTNPATSETETFYLHGVYFSHAEQTRTTDINGNDLDLINLINKTTDRHALTTLNWKLTAQKNTASGYITLDSPGTTAVLEDVMTIPSLDLEISDVDVSINTNTPETLILDVSVRKTSGSGITNRVHINVAEKATLSGNVNTSGYTFYEVVDSNDNLGKIVNGYVVAQKTQVFSLDISDISQIDRFDVTELEITARPAYHIPQADGAFWQSGAKTDTINVNPFLGVDAAATSVKLTQNNINSMQVEVDVRGTLPSANATNPANFKFDFKDAKSGRQIIDITRTFNQCAPDSESFVSFNIANLYNAYKGEAHDITCEITPIFSGSPSFEGATVTKTLNIPAEPKIVFYNSNRRGMLLSDGGSEYFATRFKPVLDSQPDYIPAGEEWFLDVVIKRADNNSIIATKTYTMDGNQFDTYIPVAIPTGVNVYTDETDDFSYRADFTGYYDLNRSGNYRVNGDLDYWSFNNDGAFKAIHHKFPKNLDTLNHNFDANGDAQITMTFQKINGETTGYSTGFSSKWEFDTSITEVVKNSLNSGNVNQTKTVNCTHAEATATEPCGIAASAFVNAVPWVPYIEDEAGYASDFNVTIVERYNNQASVNNTSGMGNFASTVNIEAGAPDFSTSVEQTKEFEKTGVTVNDLASFPNTRVLPTNIEVLDIEGEHSVSGKRFTFEVPIDFDEYFTNAEPYFSFGLKLKYKDNNGNVHTSASSYIDSSGDLTKGSNIAQEKLGLLQNSSIYKIRDFKDTSPQTYYGMGKYYFDIELRPDEFDFDVQPIISSEQKIQYILMVYIRDELLTYNSPDGKPQMTEPSDAEGTITYADIERWQEVVVAAEDDWVTKANNSNFWEPIFNNFYLETQSDNKTKFDYSFEYGIDDYTKKNYYSTEIRARWRAQAKNGSGVNIGNAFEPSAGRTLGAGEEPLTTYTLNLSHFDDKDFNPFEDIEIEFAPRMTLETKIDNVYHFGWYKTYPSLDKSFTINYKDFIIPSFDELSVDNSLNEDTINNNKTEFINKVVWFYNKTALKDVTEVFGAVNQEWVTLRRKIKQGEHTYDGGHSKQLYLHGTDAVKTSHDANTNKYVYTDNVIPDDLGNYTAQGLDGDKAYIFEYELTPAFKYQASDAGSATYTEIPEKKISTFLIPNEFPYANNGVRNLSNNYVHENKHSIQLKWDYQYTESVDTFRALDANISFELYWFMEETSSQKQVKEKLKPKRRKLEKISNNQNIDSSWNFITSIEYEYPDNPTLGELTSHSYLWKYNKMETDSNVRVAILVKVESDILGDTLSQTIGSRGVENSFSIDIKTSDKARKRKMHNDDELKRTPNRHLKREQEFTSNLSQIPFTVTRKKAKPRGSDKPYSSST